LLFYGEPEDKPSSGARSSTRRKWEMGSRPASIHRPGRGECGGQTQHLTFCLSSESAARLTVEDSRKRKGVASKHLTLMLPPM
jgi:hypothetical protein